MTYFYYGMRLRGFSLGCQPMDGFVDRATNEEMAWTLIPTVTKPKRDYYDILIYNRELTDKELKDYELDYLGTWNFDFGK